MAAAKFGKGVFAFDGAFLRYQKIHSQIWHDEKFKFLSEDGQKLFFYVMTCPHGNAVGLFVLPKLYALADLSWSEKRFDKAFTELLSKHLIYYDETVSLLLIKNHLKHNPIENLNQTKSATKAVSELPKSVLHGKIIELLDKQYHKPLLELLQKQYSEPEERTETGTEERTETEGGPTFLELWNSLPSPFPKVQKLSEGRKTKMRVRMAEAEFANRYAEIIEKIKSVPFLAGKNNRGWIADFDWVIENDKNYLKILEGKYDGRAQKTEPTKQELFDYASQLATGQPPE